MSLEELSDLIVIASNIRKKVLELVR